jgi:hypothetical protein
MNKFFKAVSSSGSVLDIVVADDRERAKVQMLFRPWTTSSSGF